MFASKNIVFLAAAATLVMIVITTTMSFTACLFIKDREVAIGEKDELSIVYNKGMISSKTGGNRRN